MEYRYWDSNVFLGWLAKEPDKVDYCRPVIDAAENEGVRIVTSALSIAEVLWIRGQDRIPKNSAGLVEAFFKNEWIVVRELDRFTAENARSLIWEYTVKPKDAIHLATALRRGLAIVQFDTFDLDLIRLSGKLGSPPLTIGKPDIKSSLPLFQRDADNHLSRV